MHLYRVDKRRSKQILFFVSILLLVYGCPINRAYDEEMCTHTVPFTLHYIDKIESATFLTDDNPADVDKITVKSIMPEKYVYLDSYTDDSYSLGDPIWMVSQISWNQGGQEVNICVDRPIVYDVNWEYDFYNNCGGVETLIKSLVSNVDDNKFSITVVYPFAEGEGSLTISGVTASVTKNIVFEQTKCTVRETSGLAGDDYGISIDCPDPSIAEVRGGIVNCYKSNVDPPPNDSFTYSISE